MKAMKALPAGFAKKQYGKTITIGGKKYDALMIETARYAVKGDGVISMADAAHLCKAARPTGDGRSTYDEVEKATMAYIRKNFKFTEAADKKVREFIAKMGAAQAQRTLAKKAAEEGSPSPKKSRKGPAKDHVLDAKCKIV